MNVDDGAEPEDQDVGGANNNSTNNNAYFDASFSIVDVEQLVLMHGLPLLWLLIDSCSTTDIFANASLLSNIHKAAKPIWSAVMLDAYNSHNKVTSAIIPILSGTTPRG